MPQTVMVEGHIDPVDLFGIYYDGISFSEVSISLGQVEFYLPVDMSAACQVPEPIPDVCWNVDRKCFSGSEVAPSVAQP